VVTGAWGIWQPKILHLLRCEKPVSRKLVKRILSVKCSEFYFTRSAWLPAAPDVVCRWHENPRNLRSICPPWLKVRDVIAEAVARPGEEFFLHVSQFGFPLRWRGIWLEVDRPHLLVDGAISSPFATWRHEHHFAPARGGTEMTDKVRCQLRPPLACLPGANLALRLVFTVMFRGRHQATRDYFTRDPQADTPLPGD
jgi:ligand-binding SRPBCC domain-containing protein